MFIPVAGLLLGLSPIGEDHHRVVLSHRGQPVAATYRPIVTVAHRQLGAPAPGGRVATLRCVSTAAVTVERHARRADGVVAVRRIAAAPVEASRTGWCDRGAAVPVADAAVRAAVAAAAARDGDALLAELDVLHDRNAG